MSGPLRLTAGRVFAGDYKVVRPLRTGGQGSLYVVEQVSTNKLRALKLMLPELVAQPTSRRRFELEAKIAARIQSDHVVESIASGVDAASGTPWLVMELLEGQDLAAYTQTKKRLPPGEVLEIFSQLCHALGEAHRQGIVHRDLKPENIFLSAPRRRGVPFMVKVLDFGIARILAESQTLSGSTATGLGTPMWMAPEQTEPGGPVSPSTDVWPLGLLAFRLLTGYLFWKAPYDTGASVMMLMAEAFMHPLPTASERADHYKCKDRLPPGFDAWFARCVARPMGERFADAAEAFAALEPLFIAFGVEMPPPSRASSVSLVSQPDPGPISSSAARASPAAPAAPVAASDPAAAPEPAAPEPAAVVSVPTSPGLGPQPTGPGRATWEGAPELAAEAVLSASASGPVSPPPLPPRASSGDQAPPVHTSMPSPTRSRTRAVIVSATLAGVLIGGAIFGLQRARAPRPGSPRDAAPGVVTATVAPTGAPTAGPREPTADPAVTASASAASTASGETTSGETTSGETTSGETIAGAHRNRHLCKPAGIKCLVNDDCCDRTCRHWVCRANAALHDPYATDGP